MAKCRSEIRKFLNYGFRQNISKVKKDWDCTINEWNDLIVMSNILIVMSNILFVSI